MIKQFYTLALATTVTILNLSAQQSDHIHVDQFGYRNDATKVAVLSDPQVGFNAAASYAPPNTLHLYDATTDQSVFIGPVALWPGGVHAQSGDAGWWFDFSAFTTTGSYYVYDLASGQRSATFTISPQPYAEVIKAAGRMYYYNRCGSSKLVQHAGTNWTDATSFMHPLQDANCRSISAPNNASLEKDLSGGWFDAGDYNKYVPFTYSTLHDLLWAVEENPLAFADDWNIPESGNGVPDLVDEVVWELEWLRKMTNPDGSCHIKMGSQNYNENAASPPSINTDQRFYGSVCTSASVTIASVFAHASTVLAPYPMYAALAADLRTKAELAFAQVLPFYTTNTLESDCDNGSIVAGDADVSAADQKDRLLVAAIYLFELTGTAAYNQFVVDHYASALVINSGDWDPYAIALMDALLRYTTLPGANLATSNAIINSATTAVNGNWNGYYGANSSDLYRAFIADWSYHWGSNTVKATYGNLNNHLAQANIGNAANNLERAAQHLHYFHGVNPLGLVYLSNMYAAGADRCVNEIYHTWFNDGTVYDNALTSPNGPAPGYVAGGANAQYAVTTVSPPYGQPMQKSFKDWNTGWPENSWELTEPAIYSQATYLRLLANYHNASSSVGMAPESAADAEIGIYPNPTNGSVFVRCAGVPKQLKLYNAQGQCAATQFNTNQMDLSALPSGIYLLRITTTKGEFYFRRVVKG